MQYPMNKQAASKNDKAAQLDGRIANNFEGLLG